MLPLLVRVEDTERGTSATYSFARSPVRIGRSSLNELALDHPSVSAWQGLVRFDESETQYFDLRAVANDTLRPVGRDVDNQCIEVGPLKLTFLRLAVPPGGLDQTASGATVVEAPPSRTVFGVGLEDSQPQPAVAPAAPAMMPPPRVATPPGAQPRARTPEPPRASFQEPGTNPGRAARAAEGPPRVALQPQRTVMLGGDAPQAVVSSASMHAPVAPAPVAPARPGSSPPGDARHRTVFLGQDAPQAAGQAPDTAVLASELRPYWEAHRRAKHTMQERLDRALAALPAGDKARTLAALADHLPGLLEESPSPRASGGGGGAAAQMVQRIAATYVPDQPLSEAQLRPFLERVTQVLDAFSQSFVELRKGHDQFSAELAVRASERTPLRTARDGRAVLRHLLDPRTSGTEAISDLTGLYADMMMHQVALLSGLMEGVRGLLEKLSPATIEKEVGKRLFGAGALWRRFVEKHGEFMEEDRALTDQIFGNDFARAYGGVVGDDSRAKKRGRK